MINSTFQKIREDFGDHASFAIWNDKDINDLNIIYGNIDLLHGRYIFVAGNPSAQTISQEKFRNFHYKHRGGRDSWLAKTIGQTPKFKGSYITDFYKGDFSITESGVISNADIIEKNRDLLKKEIKLLGNDVVLVAIGAQAKVLLENCGFKCRLIPHFAGHISFKDFQKAIAKLETEHLVNQSL